MAYSAGLTFVGPYAGSVIFAVDEATYPRQITGISGTINGAAVSGPTNYAGANNTLWGFGERLPDGSQRERGYLHDEGVSFSAGGVDYNVRNLSNSLFGQNVITSSASPGTQTPVQVYAVSDPSPVCFVTGTLIRTSRGDVAVEDLAIGDMAVTASGGLRPIIWIGHREMKAAGAVLPFHQQPVRVRAGAFGQGLPTRDLSLSPGHPILVGADADGQDGALVPVMCLINGTSVLRQPATQVTYWHIELDAHDILLAEGLAAESYYDMGSRVWFAGEDGMLTDPDFVPAGEHGRCRPVAVDGAPVEAERRRLDAAFANRLNESCSWEQPHSFVWD